MHASVDWGPRLGPWVPPLIRFPARIDVEPVGPCMDSNRIGSSCQDFQCNVACLVLSPVKEGKLAAAVSMPETVIREVCLSW